MPPEDSHQPTDALVAAVSGPIVAAMDRVKSRLRAAEGALELGLPELAHEEIEDIPPAFWMRQDVLRMRTEVFSRMSAWELMRPSATYLVENWPEDAQHWIWSAFAIRRCRSVEEAEKLMLRAIELHPAEPVIPYNLACYAAVSGRLDEARRFLDQAFHLDAGMRLLALEDPDLDPLWD